MNRTIIIAGPTASGKSQLAINLAHEISGEIINADSVAFYRYFDIGTAKPSPEDQSKVPHHLLDILSPDEQIDAAQFGKICGQVIEEINRRNKVAIVVGGSGLYLRFLMGQDFHDLPHDENLRKKISQLTSFELREKLSQVDPERASEIHPNDHFRLARAFEIFSLTNKTMRELKAVAQRKPRLAAPVIVLEPDRKILHDRIAKRTKMMLESGLIEEVKKILALGYPPSCKPFAAIGYKEVLELLAEKISPSELEDKILFATRQYAKSQCTWFRKTDTILRLKSPELTSSNIELIKKILFSAR